jgi:glycosyltransferase involved in cell wall biosynthesis
MKKPTVGIVSPFYNEEHGVDTFIKELVSVVSALDIDYRILCVDDGSTDDTITRLLACRRNPFIEVIELSRNFGKEAAITAGLDRACELEVDAVIIIDSDLQHPPKYIPDMLRKWHAGFDAVIAHRVDRQADGYLRSSLSRKFYSFINRISEVPIPEGVGDFRLLSKDLLVSVSRLRESKRFMKGIYSWAGFRCTTIEYEVSERFADESKFRLWRLWNLALEGITSFSTFPLRVWTYVGVAIGALAMLYGLWVIVQTLVYGIAVPGYASILTAVLFLGGIQLIGIGILGEYLGRTYIESKHRPPYLVRKIHRAGDLLGEKNIYETLSHK